MLMYAATRSKGRWDGVFARLCVVLEEGRVDGPFDDALERGGTVWFRWFELESGGLVLGGLFA